MVQSNIMSILVVIAVAAAILHSTEAADHIVGGSTGWTNSPPGGASFYSNWASNITFRRNDVLVFNFVTGGHTVAELTKANYDSCGVGQSIGQVLVTSPARVTLNRTGEFYFSCTFQGHCGNGQKLSVNVTGSSPAPRNSPPPAQGPAPGSAPPPQGSNPPASGTTPSPPSNGGAPPPSSTTVPRATPPSPGSATNLIATYSLLLITVVVNILF